MDLVLVGSDCYIKAHCFFWCSTREEIQSLKVVCEYICSVFDREAPVKVSWWKPIFFLAIKLQSDLIIRSILQVASILKCKLKIEIERKFC